MIPVNNNELIMHYLDQYGLEFIKNKYFILTSKDGITYYTADLPYALQDACASAGIIDEFLNINPILGIETIEYRIQYNRDKKLKELLK